jgi:hypothetical protein
VRGAALEIGLKRPAPRLDEPRVVDTLATNQEVQPSAISGKVGGHSRQPSGSLPGSSRCHRRRWSDRSWGCAVLCRPDFCRIRLVVELAPATVGLLPELVKDSGGEILGRGAGVFQTPEPEHQVLGLPRLGLIEPVKNSFAPWLRRSRPGSIGWTLQIGSCCRGRRAEHTQELQHHRGGSKVARLRMEVGSPMPNPPSVPRPASMLDTTRARSHAHSTDRLDIALDLNCRRSARLPTGTSS